MAAVVTLPVTLGAGLLASGWDIMIKLEITCPGLVSGVVLGVVLELHCAALLAVQPDGKTLVI